jgi:hypothetical protein
MILLFLSVASSTREKTFNHFHFTPMLLKTNGVVGLLVGVNGDCQLKDSQNWCVDYFGLILTNPLRLQNLFDSFVHLHWICSFISMIFSHIVISKLYKRCLRCNRTFCTQSYYRWCVNCISFSMTSSHVSWCIDQPLLGMFEYHCRTLDWIALEDGGGCSLQLWNPIMECDDQSLHDNFQLSCSWN